MSIIDLLTQNKTLINTKYRAIPEIFIEAQPRSKKLLSSTLTYKHFSSFAMRKTDLFNKSNIKTKKEVFELYQSGNTSKQKSILTKFIYIGLLGMTLAAVIFYFIFSSLEVEQPKQLEEQRRVKQDKSTPKPNQRPTEHLNDEYYVIKVVFNSRDGYYIYDSYYSIAHFRKFIKQTQSKVLSKYTIISNKNFTLREMYIYTSQEDLKQFFILPVDEKKEENEIAIRTL